MKTLIKLSALLLLISSHVSAQHKEIASGDITKVEVYYIYGNVTIEGTEDHAIRIDAIKKRKLPENFHYFTSNLKESNTDLDLNVTVKGNLLTIVPSSLQAKFTDYRIQVPNNLKVKFNNVDYQIQESGSSKGKGKSAGGIRNHTWSPASFKDLLTDTIFIKNMRNDLQIEVTYFTVLKFTNISGPIVAESFFGDIYADFSSLSQVSPSSIKSFSGQIDLTLPETINCDIVQSSFSGKFKSGIELNNMHVESPDPDVRSKTTVTNDEADTKTSGQINKGGVKLYLRTFNSDITLFGKH
jgi:hypothetical protein